MQSVLVKAKLEKKRLNFKTKGPLLPSQICVEARILRHVCDKQALRMDCKSIQPLGWMRSAGGQQEKGGVTYLSPMRSHAHGALSRERERKRCLVLLSRQWEPEAVKSLALDALILVSQMWPRNFTDSDQSD